MGGGVDVHRREHQDFIDEAKHLELLFLFLSLAWNMFIFHKLNNPLEITPF